VYRIFLDNLLFDLFSLIHGLYQRRWTPDKAGAAVVHRRHVRALVFASTTPVTAVQGLRRTRLCLVRQQRPVLGNSEKLKPSLANARVSCPLGSLWDGLRAQRTAHFVLFFLLHKFVSVELSYNESVVTRFP
jgi:hypothetical protein